MKVIRHAKGVDCNHLHVHETYKLKDVTCMACKYVLRTNEEVLKKFNESVNIDKFVQKKKIKDLDRKIATRSDKGLCCTKCLRPMVLRLNNKSNNYFFGCSGYPSCKETLPYTLENKKLYSQKKD